MPAQPLSEEQMLEALRARAEADTISGAAKLLDLDRGTFKHRLKKAEDAGLHLSEGIRGALEQTGLTPEEAAHGWRRVKDENGSFNSVFWRKPKPEDDPQAIVEALREGLEDIPRALPVTPRTENVTPSGLTAIFPVADLHIGMLTDAEEVGEDWNTKIALGKFEDTFSRLVNVTPEGEAALLAQLGDLTHTDNQTNMTPQSGHQLDADTRYFAILRRAVAAMKFAIETLRQKYPRVIYRGCRGNHDLTAHHAVTLALAEYYRDVESVEIIESAGEFYAWEYGTNMVLLHHGDRAKPERLVTFAAAEWPDIWGRTRHRLALSGHVHHETRKDVGGMVFESIGTIIPRDFHAYSHAYTARRGLVSITLDREQGEVSRARMGG